MAFPRIGLPPARELLVRLLLVAASSLATCLAAEAGYRLWLARPLLETTDLTFAAQDVAVCDFDREFGYRYLPGATGFQVFLRKGEPVIGGPLLVNGQGNIGPPVGDWEGAALRVLVVGDSFTANPYRGITWTGYLREYLERRLGRRVEVLNLARDGYGVLQMFDVAADAVTRHRPHLVVAAFISDDLSRARSWRRIAGDKTETRLYTSFRPFDTDDPRQSIDAALINPAVSWDWYNALGRNDPAALDVLARVNAQAKRYHDEFIRRHYLTVTDRSLLWSRLRHGDPFPPEVMASRNPRVTYEDYAADEGMLAACRLLASSGVPLLLVHLPMRSELESGKYNDTRQVRLLLESMQRLTGAAKLPALDFRNPVPGSFDSLFMAHDRHPNERGAAYYGALIDRTMAAAGW